MNKIYKVIYSETRKAWVVVSELVTGHSKSPGKRAMRMALAAGVLAAAVAMPAVEAHAWNNLFAMGYGASGTGMDTYYTGNYNGGIGVTKYTDLDNKTYFGETPFSYNNGYGNSSSDGTQQLGNVAVGNFATTNAYSVFADYTYVRGYREITEVSYDDYYNLDSDKQYREYDSMGRYRYYRLDYSNYNDIIRSNKDNKLYQIVGYNDDTDKLIVVDLDENYRVVDGAQEHDADFDLPNPSSLSPNGAFTNSVAIGNRAKTVNYSSVALGDNSTARGWRSIAIGADATAGSAAQNEWDDGMTAVAIGNTSKAFGRNSVALGSNAQTWSFSGVAVGRQANSGTEFGIAIGDGAQVKYRGEEEWVLDGYDENGQPILKAPEEQENHIQRLTAVHGIAIGRDSLVEGKDATAVGRNTQARMRNATAYGNNAHANAWNSIAIGNKAIAGLQVNIMNSSGDILPDSRDPNTDDLIQGAAVGNSAVAIGNRAHATSEYTTAVGAGTNAEGWHAVAVGDSNQATGRFSTAIGAGWSINSTDNEPDDDWDTGDSINSESTRRYKSIGANQAAGDYSTAVGYGNITVSERSLAVGAGNVIGDINGEKDESGIIIGGDENAEGSIAFGNGNTITGKQSIAVGTGHTISGNYSGAFGDPTVISGDNAYAIGNNNSIDTDSLQSFVMGNNVKTTKANTVVIGHHTNNSHTYGENSVSLGLDAQAQLDDSVALGSYAVADKKGGYEKTGTDDVKVGDMTYSSSQFKGTEKDVIGTVSVGTAGKTRTLTNVAAGLIAADSTEAINGSQLYHIMEKGGGSGGGGDQVDTDNRVVGLRKVEGKQRIISPFIEIQGVKDATADANENSEYAQADAERAIAIGYKSDAQGTDSIVIGSGAKAYGEQTIAIGHNAKAGDAGDSSKAKGAVAISANSQSTGEYSVAMQGSKATGDYSIAYGKDSQANTENSLAALGGTVKEDGKGSAAIGEGAQATVAGTVALGKGSIADQKSGKDQGNSGYDVLLDGESEEDDYIWRSTENAIAVGSVNGKITRRIIGVAAGHDDTDAVNVAQLKKVAEALKDSGGGSGSWNLAVNDKDPDPVKNDNTVRLNVNQPEGTELLNLTNEVNDNGERVVTWVVSDSPKFDSLTVGSKGGTFTSKGPAVFEGPVTMKENLNMSGKQIKNLGWATEDDDAVPLGQLKDYVNNTGNNFNYINNKIDKGLRHVGSRAAALAALHPLDYDPDKPTSIMAGFGHYKGDSTVALGVAHHFNDDTLVTVGSTIGHDPMVNVGLSLRLGRNTNMTEKRWKVQRYTAVDYDAKLKVMEAKYRDLKEDKDAEISALRRELQSLREDMRTLRGTKGTRK